MSLSTLERLLEETQPFHQILHLYSSLPLALTSLEGILSGTGGHLSPLRVVEQEEG